MKRTWLPCFLSLIALLAAGCFRKFPAKVSETEQLSTPLPPGGTLRITTLNGSIRVQSGNVEQAKITATKVVRSRTDEDAVRYCSETKIEAELQADGVAVTVVLPEGHEGRASIAVSIEAVVPRTCSLDLNASNGAVGASEIFGDVDAATSNGGVVIEHIEGNVVAETSNGGVDVDDVSGSVKGYTSNGRVFVRYARGDVECRASNGGVDLHDVAGNVNARTSNGHITCLLPRNVSAVFSGGTSNGKLRSEFPGITRGKRLSGKTGDGKFSIDLTTTNGNIFVRRSR